VSPDERSYAVNSTGAVPPGGGPAFSHVPNPKREEGRINLRAAAEEERRARDIEHTLGQHRRSMRKHGLILGELTENLRHIDETEET